MRQKWARTLVSLLLLLSFPIVSESQLSIASIWKARALEATDNLTWLQEKLQKHKPGSKEATFLA